MFTKIARDGVCVITNTPNPLPNLSEEQVQGIFTGRIRDWSEVPRREDRGPDRPVRPRRRLGYAGRLPAHLPRRNPEDLAERDPETSNGLEQSAVGADKQAIGFVSFAYTGGVHAVGYEGVACNLRNAKSGQYGGVRNFWMVTKGAPKGEALKFIKLGDEREPDDQKDHQLELDRHPLAAVPAGARHRTPARHRIPAKLWSGRTGAPSACSARSPSACWR